ncbi:hypothetical protein B0H10DRAFT_535375 [Mycena sp. CBHHK59/15]|nr:hypothetical protein B0H10DRAFT_535375 [Mycena sp. CBHHK59/15]
MLPPLTHMYKRSLSAPCGVRVACPPGSPIWPLPASPAPSSPFAAFSPVSPTVPNPNPNPNPSPNAFAGPMAMAMARVQEGVAASYHEHHSPQAYQPPPQEEHGRPYARPHGRQFQTHARRDTISLPVQGWHGARGVARTDAPAGFGPGRADAQGFGLGRADAPEPPRHARARGAYTYPPPYVHAQGPGRDRGRGTAVRARRRRGGTVRAGRLVGVHARGGGGGGRRRGRRVGRRRRGVYGVRARAAVAVPARVGRVTVRRARQGCACGPRGRRRGPVRAAAPAVARVGRRRRRVPVRGRRGRRRRAVPLSVCSGRRVPRAAGDLELLDALGVGGRLWRVLASVGVVGRHVLFVSAVPLADDDVSGCDDVSLRVEHDIPGCGVWC